MNRNDLDPCDLEPLIAGSARVKCQDDAALRAHQLQRQRNERSVHDQYAPRCWPVVVFACVLGAAAAALAFAWPDAANFFSVAYLSGALK